MPRGNVRIKASELSGGDWMLFDSHYWMVSTVKVNADLVIVSYGNGTTEQYHADHIVTIES